MLSRTLGVELVGERFVQTAPVSVAAGVTLVGVAPVVEDLYTA